MTLSPGGPDIIEFAMSDKYLGKAYFSIYQQAILKALYGLEMTREELLAFLELSDGRKPRPGGYEEAAIICGVRSGKSDIGAVVATYEGVRWGPVMKDMLIPGQVATVILIAQDQKGAGIVRGYIEGNLRTLEDRGFEVLAETQGQAKAITGSAIKLRWPVEFIIFPANKAAVRGATGLCGVLDEIGHWKNEEGAYNQDKKVVKAFRSRFATLAKIRPKRLMISNPDEESGVLWEEYKKRDSGRVLVVNAPTWKLNPQIELDDPTFFDREEEDDPEGFQSEYGAVFAKPGGGNLFLTAQIVDQCIERGRVSNPPKPGVEYTAWMDAAFKRDRFSFGIGHSEVVNGQLRAVVDHLRNWTPPKRKGADLDPEEVVNEIVTDLLMYGCSRIHGDQFADTVLKSMFMKRGIVFVECPATNPEKTDAYKNLRASLQAHLVDLPDNPEMEKDLKGLVRLRTTGNHTTIAAPRRRNAYDDAATVVSRLVRKLLPLTGNVDLVKINAEAMPHIGVDGHDYRTAEEKEFGPGLMEAIY